MMASLPWQPLPPPPTPKTTIVACYDYKALHFLDDVFKFCPFLKLFMFVILCSKSIKKEKCKDRKDFHEPQTQHTPINSDDDDDVLVGPWLSTGGKKKDAKVNSRPQSDDDRAATLIVCPLSVLSNWTVSVNLASQL